MYKEVDQFKNIFDNIHIQTIKQHASINRVPIIKDDGLKLLLQVIQSKKPHKILEIGTAIGYSSIQMARFSNALIDTIERDPKMVECALRFITDLNYEQRIHVHYKDALDISLDELEASYDLIFIDAAKAQYQKFFEKFAPLLSNHGIIVSDNLSFHGLVHQDQPMSKNVRGLVKKIEKYIDWLSHHNQFETTFYNVGDGIAVSERKSR